MYARVSISSALTAMYTRAIAYAAYALNIVDANIEVERGNP